MNIYIFHIWINGQHIIVFSCHLRTEGKYGEIKDMFMMKMSRFIIHINIIIWDIDANKGQENIYRLIIAEESLHSTFNDNGARLMYFIISHGIIISSTYF
jgi:hypothetical protein